MKNVCAYYNEIDPFAAQWLRNLIAEGHIAHGEVDDRSIVDVRPSDLAGFDQCHFFAGIGGWSLALRLAGWSDDRAVWTGSCPCQPFSAAGQGSGFDDERHLWPAFFHLIEQCRPHFVFGEQVASPHGLTWLDLVQSDMEATGHAFAAIDLCAAGFGAPHIRQRLYWVADSKSRASWAGLRNHGSSGQRRLEFADDSAIGVMVDGQCTGLERLTGNGDSAAGWPFKGGSIAAPSFAGFANEQRCPVNGIWRNADWLFCRDGRWRPVEPGTFPLGYGISFKVGSGSALEGKSRIGMLRGYGNAIVPQTAAAFITAVMEAINAAND